MKRRWLGFLLIGGLMWAGAKPLAASEATDEIPATGDRPVSAGSFEMPDSSPAASHGRHWTRKQWLVLGAVVAAVAVGAVVIANSSGGGSGGGSSGGY
jgi:hypothetical protein